MKCTCKENMAVVTSYKQSDINVVTIFACSVCGRIEKVQTEVNDSKVKGIVRAFKNTSLPGGLVADVVSDMTNTMTFRGEGFAESMRDASDEVKALFTDISLLWLMKLNYFNDIKYFDSRNEFSVEMAVELWKVFKDTPVVGTASQEIIEYTQSQSNVLLDSDLDFRAGFVIYFSMEHRTLQQTFSGLVFNWLKNMSVSSEVKDKLIKLEERKPYFWKTPLI